MLCFDTYLAYVNIWLYRGAMKNSFTRLRTQQLDRSLKPFDGARTLRRPSRGWIRAVRQALGLSMDEVGRAARASRQAIQLFEKAESTDRITLASLRKIANAMGCELVYALVPKEGTFEQLADRPARDEAAKRVLSVEHTMALEGQAVGGVKEKIDEETRRILKKQK